MNQLRSVCNLNYSTQYFNCKAKKSLFPASFNPRGQTQPAAVFIVHQFFVPHHLKERQDLFLPEIGELGAYPFYGAVFPAEEIDGAGEARETMGQGLGVEPFMAND